MESCGNTKIGGPASSLKAGDVVIRRRPELLLTAATDWLANTGRFCVTACPKFDPNTPMSKLRPYPMRTTVFAD